jgi:hypothetical protein
LSSFVLAALCIVLNAGLVTPPYSLSDDQAALGCLIALPLALLVAGAAWSLREHCRPLCLCRGDKDGRGFSIQDHDALVVDGGGDDDAYENGGYRSLNAESGGGADAEYAGPDSKRCGPRPSVASELSTFTSGRR